jgi:hypothetical protein
MASSKLIYVEMKTRRAQEHFDALQMELDRWIRDPKHCLVREADDFDNARHIFRIQLGAIPEIIPMLLGDFVCCLRSSLDQLAWALALINRSMPLSEKEERDIHFLIFKERNSRYDELRRLFPPTVADVIDSFQPYLRGQAYRDDPLWQLNELWRMDKHRAIPMNSGEITVGLPVPEWNRLTRHVFDGVDHSIEVNVPLVWVYTGQVAFKPAISIEILFGEHMGKLAVSRARLSTINDFVRNDVVPSFTSFFS